MQIRKIVTHKKWLEWAYTLEGFIFYRFTDPDINDSPVELYQVVPNRKIKNLIETL
jgi:hypothetical protein